MIHACSHEHLSFLKSNNSLWGRQGAFCPTHRPCECKLTLFLACWYLVNWEFQCSSWSSLSVRSLLIKLNYCGLYRLPYRNRNDEGCMWAVWVLEGLGGGRRLNIPPSITLIWFEFPLTGEDSFRTSWCQRIFHNVESPSPAYLPVWLFLGVEAVCRPYRYRRLQLAYVHVYFRNKRPREVGIGAKITLNYLRAQISCCWTLFISVRRQLTKDIIF